MSLDNNNHSVFKLKYCLILFTVKHIVTDPISDRLKDVFVTIASNYNITLEEWSYDKQKIKIIFYAHPNSELSKFINAYKSASSRLIKKEIPNITDQNNKTQFWSKTYCLLTKEHGINENEIEMFIAKTLKKN